MPCPFNAYCKRALMLRAVACNSSWKNFAPFGDKAPKLRSVFVIYGVYFIGAESANALFPAATFFMNHILPPINILRD
jgi:hypothetical protein